VLCGTNHVVLALVISKIMTYFFKEIWERERDGGRELEARRLKRNEGNGKTQLTVSVARVPLCAEVANTHTSHKTSTNVFVSSPLGVIGEIGRAA
jgi:hypothetical protein